MIDLRLLVLWMVVAVAGCDCGGGDFGMACESSAECASGFCRDGRCVDRPEPDAGGDPDGPCATTCGTTCCAGGELCLMGSRCARDLGPCTGDGDCGDDGWCSTEVGRCVPYDETRDHNPMCELVLSRAFRTRIQCEWAAPPAGDPHPGHVNASSLPIVIDFGLTGPDDPPHPWIVVAMGPADGGSAILRVLDGTTCAQIDNLDEHAVVQGAAPAAGDIDGDGRPEVVAALESGGVAAWTWDVGMSAFRVLWRSADSTTGSLSAAVTLADLDDAGGPEILVGTVVYAADGTLLDETAGLGDRHCGGGRGYLVPGIVGDVDLDGLPEVVRGTGTFSWDAAGTALVREAYSTGAGIEGPSAIADFGDFPGAAGDAPGRAESAVIAGGAGYLVSIGGDVVFGPVPFPGVGDGGNPTIADFDGDGQAEFATAGYSSYTVFDPDCLPGAARGGACGSGRTDGILWTQVIQENSCAIMGSTVFDFEADGAAEVVYADECYARVFDGRDGRVVWSRRRSSATWIEGPTVADVDGDIHAEMVLTATDAYRPSCPGVDPIFPGSRCATDADCAPAGAGSCVESLCRCTMDADCGDPELTCTTPIDGTPGTGNVCRSTFAYLHGVRVYADVNDRWAASRPIWNQHGYSVTNVEDDGRIPRASVARRNWEVAGLNNFRQNVQGDVEPDAGADLTVVGVSFGRDCSADMPELELVANVCNRGLLAVPAGVVVVFYDGDPDAGGTEVCRAATTGSLASAACEELRCTWSGPPVEMSLEVHIATDPDDVVPECIETNNHSTLEARCPPGLL